MKVLITGAAGFIGSNLLRYLLQDSSISRVYAVDNFSNGRLELLENAIETSLRSTTYKKDFELDKVEFRECNFSKMGSRFSCVSGSIYEELGAVIHLAAMPRVSLSIERPGTSLETNLCSTVGLLNEIVHHNPSVKVIFASSSAVYGDTDPGNLGQSTSSRTNPLSPYALHKLQVEEHLKLYDKVYGLRSVSLRFFNVYGSRQVGGSLYSNAISSWLRNVYANEPLKLFGDGSHSRDLIHVTDVVAAIKAALKLPVEACQNAKVFNIGTGRSYTNLEIIGIIKALHPNSKVEYCAPRAGDAQKALADIRDTVFQLGWEPKVDVETGIVLTDAWLHDNWSWAGKLSMKW